MQQQDKLYEMLIQEDEITWQTIIYDLVKEIKPEVLNISMFSSRQKTKASKLKQLPSELIKERSKKLSDLYINYRSNL